MALVTVLDVSIRQLLTSLPFRLLHPWLLSWWPLLLIAREIFVSNTAPRYLTASELSVHICESGFIQSSFMDVSHSVGLFLSSTL